MLQLDDGRWSELTHAYGAASDIPHLLRQLVESPRQMGPNDEPWFTSGRVFVIRAMSAPCPTPQSRMLSVSPCRRLARSTSAFSCVRLQSMWRE